MMRTQVATSLAIPFAPKRILLSVIVKWGSASISRRCVLCWGIALCRGMLMDQEIRELSGWFHGGQSDDVAQPVLLL